MSVQRPMIVYGVPFSVHTRKVILTARFKSIPYQVTPVVPVIPGNPPPSWRTISPSGLIPAIDDGGFLLADSTAIALYLERKVPEPALVPSELQDHGRALFWDGWAGDALFRRIVHPLFHNQIVSPNIHKRAGDSAAIEAALGTAASEAFGYLESASPEGFLVGSRVSIADLAVVSNLLVFHYLGHRIDTARYPKLISYFRRQLDSSLLQGAVQAEAPFVDSLGLDRTFLTRLS